MIALFPPGELSFLCFVHYGAYRFVRLKGPRGLPQFHTPNSQLCNTLI